MNIAIDDQTLTEKERAEFQRLLARSNHNPPQLEDMLEILDTVWDELGCNNRQLDWNKIGEYYSHPVWLLNGYFIEQHDLSMRHRHAIADWITGYRHNIQSILDYGGGFGTLARLMSQKNSNLSVDIYEPHPTQVAIAKVKDFPNVSFVDSLDRQYDCLVSTDVLEHVSDPLNLFAQMIELVKVDGYLVIDNNFYPIIKCHLPETFHFRYTFDRFAELMGLKKLGCCEHTIAVIYQKQTDRDLDWQKIRQWEKISRLIFPIAELFDRAQAITRAILRPIKRIGARG